MQRVETGTSLTEQAVRALRESILSGELAPGELYSVYGLADKLGVSRTPVREAMLRLAAAGMVRIERNRGFRVLHGSAEDVLAVFQLRLLLEPPAAARTARRVGADPQVKGLLFGQLTNETNAMKAAARHHDEPRFMRHDRALHRHVLALAGNTKLVDLVDGLRDITVTLGASTVDRSRTLDDIAAEHLPLVAALLHADPAGAAAAMRAHLLHTGQLLLDQLARDGQDVSRLDLDLDWTVGT